MGIGRGILNRISAVSAALTVCIALSGLAAASAEDQFPASQFGKARLSYTQSLGGNDDYIRSQQNGVFEPLAEFNETDAFRARSRPVGRLSMLIENSDGSKGVGTCTASLIDPTHLITNYHCIPGHDGTVLEAVIHMGYLREDQEPVDVYEVDIDPVDADPDLDFAVLAVRGDPGKKYGFVELNPVKVQPNASLVIYHHPAGLPLRLTRFRCKAYAGNHYRGTEFRHRCDTLGGSSGSLIFNNDHKVVALHHSGGLTGDANSSFNSGTAIAAILARLGSPAAPALSADRPAVQNRAASLQAGAPTARHYVIASVPRAISESKLNVRSNAGLSYQVIGSIPAAADDVVVFPATCRQADDGRTKKPWCQIDWRGLQGWASISGLRW
ncbi:trypsin-like peptidase domain-containing protein [Hoeflea sp.]|uniref:trypsin-like peptidase domain-containing protein n=1 Tax=Hoeflea sp. TaxID=1940281 RepID=UPI003A903D99